MSICRLEFVLKDGSKIDVLDSRASVSNLED